MLDMRGGQAKTIHSNVKEEELVSTSKCAHRCVQDVSDFLLQHNNKLFSFVSELMDIMLAGEDQSQADQPNSLAEGPPM